MIDQHSSNQLFGGSLNCPLRIELTIEEPKFCSGLQGMRYESDKQVFYTLINFEVISFCDWCRAIVFGDKKSSYRK